MGTHVVSWGSLSFPAWLQDGRTVVDLRQSDGAFPDAWAAELESKGLPHAAKLAALDSEPRGLFMIGQDHDGVRVFYAVTDAAGPRTSRTFPRPKKRGTGARPRWLTYLQKVQAEYAAANSPGPFDGAPKLADREGGGLEVYANGGRVELTATHVHVSYPTPSPSPRWNPAEGWIGGDSRTLYAFTCKATGAVTVRPGSDLIAAPVGPEATVAIATRAQAEEHWQRPLGTGWRVVEPPERADRAGPYLAGDRIVLSHGASCSGVVATVTESNATGFGATCGACGWRFTGQHGDGYLRADGGR